MDRVILLRHAKAERNAASGDDFDRALDERGVSDARLMGKVLAAAGFKPDLALVSPAARTVQTWEAAAEALGETTTRQDSGLYHAAAVTLRRRIEELEGRSGALILVGHNPGIHQLVVDLLVEGAASPSTIERARQKFPTASAAAFEMDVAGRPVFAGLYFAADYGGGGGE